MWVKNAPALLRRDLIESPSDGPSSQSLGRARLAKTPLEPCECGGRERYLLSREVRREAARDRAKIDVFISDDHLST